MNCGNEALLVLQFHRVEDAAVGVDADEKIVLRRDREHVNFNRKGTVGSMYAKSRIVTRRRVPSEWSKSCCEGVPCHYG